MKRLKIKNNQAFYHCMTRTVNGEKLFGNREREMLRKMIWQVADFSGVEVLTYCVMANHFHVLIRVPFREAPVPDAELVRRFGVLYPKPTRYQPLVAADLKRILEEDAYMAEQYRASLMARMEDVSQFMKTLKQRFSVWFNRSQVRFGTLWADRFKSVLVEGAGNPLQTMAAYIDLNPVRAGMVKDPKDYRFSGYGEAVGGSEQAQSGICRVWQAREGRVDVPLADALQSHRRLLYGKGANPWTHKGKLIDRKEAVRVLEKEDGKLPWSAALRCRVRYFTDGAILGSAEFVAAWLSQWQSVRGRQYRPKVHPFKGKGLEDLNVIKGLRSRIFD